MDPTDATRRKDLNAGAMRDPHGGGNGRCAIPFFRNRDGPIPCAHFSDAIARGNLLKLIRIQSHAESAIENRNRGRYGAALAYDLLKPLGGGKVLRPGQAMSNYG